MVVASAGHVAQRTQDEKGHAETGAGVSDGAALHLDALDLVVETAADERNLLRFVDESVRGTEQAVVAG